MTTDEQERIEAVRSRIENATAFDELPTVDAYYNIIQGLTNADKDMRYLLSIIDARDAEIERLRAVAPSAGRPPSDKP